jgi:hypothetical protein
MKICMDRFNIYLMVAVVALVGGCSSPDPKSQEEKNKEKEASTLRFHLEVNPDNTGRNGPVKVVRTNPITINVTWQPFLTEVDMERAELVDSMGVPAIMVQFSHPSGVRLLEYYTGNYKGQRIAIQSDFGQPRWLAAPQINQRIENGVFVFTPDANVEECERIVRGLNNMIRQIKKKK